MLKKCSAATTFPIQNINIKNIDTKPMQLMEVKCFLSFRILKFWMHFSEAGLLSILCVPLLCWCLKHPLVSLLDHLALGEKPGIWVVGSAPMFLTTRSTARPPWQTLLWVKSGLEYFFLAAGGHYSNHVSLALSSLLHALRRPHPVLLLLWVGQ